MTHGTSAINAWLAIAAVVLMIRGPIRHAYGGAAAPKVALR